MFRVSWLVTLLSLSIVKANMPIAECKQTCKIYKVFLVLVFCPSQMWWTEQNKSITKSRADMFFPVFNTINNFRNQTAILFCVEEDVFLNNAQMYYLSSFTNANRKNQKHNNINCLLHVSALSQQPYDFCLLLGYLSILWYSGTY